MPKPAKAPRLTREDWLHQALEALAAHGPAKLNIQTLCEALGVSRGSFYWHFANREAFIRELLDLWHQEYSLVEAERIEAEGGSGREKFEHLVQAIFEQGLTDFDLPIRAWAIQEPDVAELLARTDHFRLDYVTQLFAEMGFSGQELEMRARIAVAALIMQDHLMDERGMIKTAASAKLLCRMLCAEAEDTRVTKKQAGKGFQIN